MLRKKFPKQFFFWKKSEKKKFQKKIKTNVPKFIFKKYEDMQARRAAN